jgi:predicted nucleotidyltransferase
MFLNKLISSYLNDEGSSGLSLGESPINDLKIKINSVINQDTFLSFEHSYSTHYKKANFLDNLTIDPVEQIEIKEIHSKALREFYEYANEVFTKDEILGVYFHGSIGYGDYIPGSSDLDALIVIRKDIFNSQKKLGELKRKISKANSFLYLFDPLQHHNLHIISELDMQFYDEAIFPLVLFNYAKEVTKFSNSLSFRPVINQDNKYNLLSWWIQQLSPSNRQQFNIRSSHGAKHAVQSVLFLPIIYQQIKGKYMFKKYVYGKVKPEFDHKIWEVVERATLVRNKIIYKSYYPYLFRKLIGSIHFKYLRLLHHRFDRNISSEILKFMGVNFIDEAYNLAVEMQEKVLKK